MKCHLTTSCSNEATEKVVVNDWRTSFVPVETQACAECAAREPQVKADHDEWLEKQLEKGSDP